MLVIGLISGTSADGVDAALVEISTPFRLCLRGWLTVPYPPRLRQAVLSLGSGDAATAGDVCRVSFAVAGAFAEAALAVCRQAGVSPDEVDLVGSHGQTVWHEPAPADPELWAAGSTLQLGQPAVIAERTGIRTIADFRPRDMAAGGQGAPLTPIVDYMLFSHATEGRILLNIGGIANITVLPAGGSLEGVRGFDTGPGNMLIDGAVTALTGGASHYDRDGQMAGSAQGDAAWLDELIREEPYYGRTPPKSTGRELYGPAYLQRCLRRASERGLTPEATVATLTELTAATIAGAIDRYVLPEGDFRRLIASGGGIHNAALMRSLRRRLGALGLDLATSDLPGALPPDAKEAVAFAVLAWLTASGLPGNIPGVTGAERPAALGVDCPGKAMVARGAACWPVAAASMLDGVGR
jgi:anhydro-N-acetylmuramic acid kinase